MTFSPNRAALNDGTTTSVSVRTKILFERDVNQQDTFLYVNQLTNIQLFLYIHAFFQKSSNFLTTLT